MLENGRQGDGCERGGLTLANIIGQVLEKWPGQFDFAELEDALEELYRVSGGLCRQREGGSTDLLILFGGPGYHFGR